MKYRFAKFALLAPVAISLLMITAHFVRDKQSWLAAVYMLLFVVFLFFREPVMIKILQAALAAAGCEWLRTAFILVSLRMQEEASWVRLAVILIGTACFTFASIFVFRAKALIEVYGTAKKPDS